MAIGIVIVGMDSHGNQKISKHVQHMRVTYVYTIDAYQL